MAPERVRAVAELGQRRGFDLFVMYGATEATARMAVLPPDLALVAPGVDRPPAARHGLRARSGRGPGRPSSPASASSSTRGPNVMLGYAEIAGRPGRRPHRRRAAHRRLRAAAPTGSGRSSAGPAGSPRCCGLRIDLDRVERALARAGDRRRRRRRRRPGGRRRRRRRAPVDAEAVRRARRRRRRARPPPASRSSCCPTCRGWPTARPTTAALGGRWRRATGTPASAPGVRRAATADDVTALCARLLGRPEARARRLVRRPRRRLAVLRRGVAAARGAARPPARRLAARCPSPRSPPRARRSPPAGRRGRDQRRCCGRWRSSPSSARTPTSSRCSAARTCCWRSSASTWAASSSATAPRARADAGRSCAALARVVVPSVLVIGAVAAVSPTDIDVAAGRCCSTALHRVELDRAAAGTTGSSRRWSPGGAGAGRPARRARRRPRSSPAAPVRHSRGAGARAAHPRYDVVGVPGDHVHRAHVRASGCSPSAGPCPGPHDPPATAGLRRRPGPGARVLPVGGLERRRLRRRSGCSRSIWVPQVRLPAPGRRGRRRAGRVVAVDLPRSTGRSTPAFEYSLAAAGDPALAGRRRGRCDRVRRVGCARRGCGAGSGIADALTVLCPVGASVRRVVTGRPDERTPAWTGSR